MRLCLDGGVDEMEGVGVGVRTGQCMAGRIGQDRIGQDRIGQGMGTGTGTGTDMDMAGQGVGRAEEKVYDCMLLSVLLTVAVFCTCIIHIRIFRGSTSGREVQAGIQG